MRNNAKLILVIVLGIAAVFSVMHGITASSSKRNRAAAPAVMADQNQKSVSGEKVLPMKRLAARTKFKAWRRHLFMPVETTGESSAPVLSGIFAKGNIYKAMIGDTIVMKGDKIGSNTVIDVQKNKVILNDGTKDFELKLEK